MADVAIRSISLDELPAFMDSLELAFHERHENGVEQERLIAEPDRYFVAVDDDEIVGTAGACTTSITVPGGRSLTAPGITAVGVRPSHRRRGINTALMTTLLDQAVERGEPFAYLWASESPIYGRFGYGMASLCSELEVPTDRGSFVGGVELSGRVRVLPRERALPLMRPVYDEVAAGRPGMIAIDERWWTWLFFERKSDEEKPPYYVVHDADTGSVDGYAVYKVKQEWRHGVPASEVEVQHLIATTPEATASLWRYLLDLDLMSVVKAWDRPADDEILRLVAEPRRLRFMLSDGLWVRLLDIPAALGGRGYMADGRLVLDVRDEVRPAVAGRYEFVVRDGEPSCSRVEDSSEPDLACDVAALGAAYLGGTSFHDLARVRQARELVPGALERADAMFAADPSPWFGFVY
jgi:predicted acetyltransferase